ncbi:hypothetical protein [Streptomyces sp. Isolate_219]|uniref:hypothetical protein n=1 Tax=Streptomyces sp. Isolate_219 TaxID=2950110 RepID=UPI0021CA982B|nr:hypothetical protein [Streptomyces sp. Isolate_219]MCR8574619.1 hypothetical protein [Streptomyces sp. Isolate_219]
MEYKSPVPLPKEESERVFAEGEPPAISETLIAAALNGEDREWVERWIVLLSQHPDVGVRKTTAVALGHLARLHGSVSSPAITAIQALLKDERTAGAAGDGLDDVNMFCRRN